MIVKNKIVATEKSNLPAKICELIAERPDDQLDKIQIYIGDGSIVRNLNSKNER